MDTKRTHGRGVILAPTVPTDAERREAAAVADIEARLQDGSLDAEQADREILELALNRFDFYSKDILEELRLVGLALIEEPESVESRMPGPKVELSQ